MNCTYGTRDGKLILMHMFELATMSINSILHAVHHTL